MNTMNLTIASELSSTYDQIKTLEIRRDEIRKLYMDEFTNVINPNYKHSWEKVLIELANLDEAKHLLLNEMYGTTEMISFAA